MDIHSEFMDMVKKWFRSIETTFSGLVYILLFLFMVYPYRDYDWGWHYRYGEYVIKTGRVMMTDIWSWPMHGYPWVNHSWLYDPLMYLVFSSTSFLGMSIAGAIVGFIPFLLLIKLYKLSYWQKGILAYFYFQLTSGVYWQGLRSQMIGNMLLAVCLFLLIKLQYLVLEEKSFGKFHFKTHYPFVLLPPLFLLWGNLHGSFTMGILLFGIFLSSAFFILFLRYRKNASQEKRFFIPKPMLWTLVVFIASFLLTMVNPFTYSVYLEAVRHTNSFLLPYILEWDPAQKNSFFFFIFLLFAFLLVVGVAVRRKMTDLPLILVSLVFFYLSLNARRYNADFVTVSLPLAALALTSFTVHLEKFRATAFMFVLSCAIAAEVLVFQMLPTYHLWGYSFKDYCSLGSNCSEGLTSYLLKNPPKGDGFNFYDWGGYLIGRGVEAQFFIDGRMHLWEGKNHYYPFLEYQKMYYEGDYKKFNYYNFDWVIIPSESNLSQVLQKTEGWKTLYKDQDALYVIRKR